MKEKVSPAVAVVAIIVVVAIAAFAWTKLGGGPAAGTAGDKPPGMPADAAAEMQKRMGSANPTGAGNIRGAAPSGPGAGYLGPPGAPK